MKGTTYSYIVPVDADDLSHQILKAPCRIHPKCHHDLQNSRQGALSRVGVFQIVSEFIHNCQNNCDNQIVHISTSSYISSGFFLFRNTRFHLKFLICLRVSPPS